MASCHNGDLEIAKALVRAATTAGADIIKFQSWKSKDVRDSDPDKKRYESLEFKDEWHSEIMEYCRGLKVEFLTTIFDKNRIPFLKALGLQTVKVASYDCRNTDFLKLLRDHFPSIIVSTGGTYPEEVALAAKTLAGHDYTFMHCVLAYPTPLEHANLGRMKWLQEFAPKVGYSDHTEGAEAGKIAIAMGAYYVEKHFTLSRFLPQALHKTTTDTSARAITTHEIAAEFPVLKELCDYARLAETIIGNGSMLPISLELGPREKYSGRLGNRH